MPPTIHYDYSDIVRDPTKQSKDPAIRAAFEQTLDEFADKLSSTIVGDLLKPKHMRLLAAILCDAQARKEDFSNLSRTIGMYKRPTTRKASKRPWLSKTQERKLRELLEQAVIIAQGVDNAFFGDEMILEAVNQIRDGTKTLLRLGAESRNSTIASMKKIAPGSEDPTDFNMKEIYEFFRQDKGLTTRRAEHFTAQLGNKFLAWNVDAGTEKSGCDAVRKRIQRKHL